VVGHHHFSWSNRSTQEKVRSPRPRFHFLRIITIPPLYRDMEMVRIGLWEYPGSTNGEGYLLDPPKRTLG
jgi:hypothetical protein